LLDRAACLEYVDDPQARNGAFRRDIDEDVAAAATVPVFDVGIFAEDGIDGALRPSL
jgi:hypothetical protein